MINLESLVKLFKDTWQKVSSLVPDAALNIREDMENLFLEAQNSLLGNSIEQQKNVQEQIKLRYMNNQIVPDAQLRGREFERNQILLDIKARTTKELEQNADTLLAVTELTEETDKDIINAVIVELRSRGKHETADRLRAHFWDGLNIEEPWKTDRLYQQSAKIENELSVWKNHLAFHKAYLANWETGEMKPVSGLFTEIPSNTPSLKGVALLNSQAQAQELFYRLKDQIDRLVKE